MTLLVAGYWLCAGAMADDSTPPRPAGWLWTCDGQTRFVRLRAISEAGEFAFQSATLDAASGPSPRALAPLSMDNNASAAPAESFTLPLEELDRWGSWPRAAAGLQVELRAGGRIIGSLVKWTDQRVRMDLAADGGEINLPQSAIARFIWQPDVWNTWQRHHPTLRVPDTAAAFSSSSAEPGGDAATAPDDITSKTSDSVLVANKPIEQDQVWFINGDVQSGTVTDWRDRTIFLQTAAGELALETVNLVAVEFAPSRFAAPAADLAEIPPGTKFWIGLTDGTRVLAGLPRATPAGFELPLEQGGFMSASAAALCAIQPLHPRVRYLSDLPGSYKHVPWLTQSWDYQRDRNVLGGSLLSGGVAAVKGLGLHSAARLTYVLPDHCLAFAAEVGIDDATAGGGEVICRIYGDAGTGEWRLLRVTPIVRGGDAPLPVRVDLTGQKRLSLLVDYGREGGALDHADWLNARVIVAAP
ncbi:MAG: NPCBM/NEW2 domain-containing protein [Pirellulales bacterium]|nr:NPCBM/NEW2 domain-containing protein [Pirellulales bacterium]